MSENYMIDSSLRVLFQFFSSATNHASAAMCQWTNGLVHLSLDEIVEAPLEEVAAQLNVDMDLQTMIVLGVDGSESSQLILSFDETNGRRLAAALLNREVSEEPEWSDLEQSAIMETGNILGSSYLNELTRLMNRELKPSAPMFVQDFGPSILQQALMVQAMTSEKIIICQTRFEFNDQEVDWNVFFVPDQDLVKSIDDALKTV